MTTITSEQIRKNIGKEYGFDIGKYSNECEDIALGEALIASAEFRRIAYQLKNAGYQVEQVRQERYILAPIVGSTSTQTGLFYLRQNGSISVKDLARIEGLQKYKLQRSFSNEFLDEEYISGRIETEKDGNLPKNEVILFFNRQAPVDGLRARLEKLADIFRGPCQGYISKTGDRSVRIA
jgi:hypothetical protein